ncbi:unnamed protein product [Rhizophagus irregularis]|nr:unnamed protein product [Rhizophagus irregularis]
MSSLLLIVAYLDYKLVLVTSQNKIVRIIYILVFCVPFYILPWKIPNKANNRSDLNPNKANNRSSSNDQIPNKTNNNSSLNDPNKANDYVTSLNDQIKIYGVAIKSLYRKRFDLELF